MQLALSAIQNMSSVELSNIQHLLSVKDAELRAAEEGVLGLKEVTHSINIIFDLTVVIK